MKFFLHSLPVAFGLLHAVGASPSSFPSVLWSSYPSPFEHPPSTAERASIVEVLKSQQVCDADLVVFVEHPGLRASDLRHSALLSQKASTGTQLLQIAHTQRISSDLMSAEALAKRCGMKFVHWAEAGDMDQVQANRKHVVYLDLPPIHEEGAWRKDDIASQERVLTERIAMLESRFPRNLVVYSGSASRIERREDGSEMESIAFTNMRSNTTLPTGSILHRYQLLTPALITALLVVLFVLLPIIAAAISALSGIQSSVRMDAPKIVSQEKKVQ